MFICGSIYGHFCTFVNNPFPMKYIVFSVLLLSFLSSCTKQPDLAGFDAEAFKQDRYGCGTSRMNQAAWLKEHKMTWKGVTSNNMEDILGKPDIQQLADRNQEYYIYFLSPGPQCENIKNPSQARTVAFRFSAMGLATEITFQNGIPY